MSEDASTFTDVRTRVIILTGPVGSGKTSLLNSLLQLRPPGERWAVLMNDTGKTEVGANIDKTDVEVRTVFGACENSVKTGVPMRTAVLQTLKKPRPLCFLIELSTIAQPVVLQELLLSVGGVATVQVVAMVPQNLHSELWRSSAAYSAQLEQADVLAVRKCEGPPLKAEEGGNGMERSFLGKDAVVWEFGSANAPTCSSAVSLEQVASALLKRTLAPQAG